MFEYDPEVPAGYQEADILQAQYEAESNAMMRDQAKGICHHGSRLGRKVPAFYSAEDVAAMVPAERSAHYGVQTPFQGGQDKIPEGQDLCTECGSLVEAWEFE